MALFHMSRRFFQFVTVIVGLATASLALAGEYSFKVHNKTTVAIAKVLVKEPGGSWGSFDIGGEIAPGKIVKLVWSENTNNEECKQWIKVVYADGSEAEPAKFDFCENDLVIEFE